MSSSVETINIAVPVAIVAVAQRAVEAGEYASISDVVSDALMDWYLERTPQAPENLRRLWQEALADESPGIPYEEVMDDLKQRCRQIVATSGSPK